MGNISKDLSFYLRGLAISVVLLSHYAQYFLTDIYDDWIRGSGHGAVSIFFLLAGTGAYHSFVSSPRPHSLNLKSVLAYYWGRAKRIYPLYWTALLLMPLYMPGYHELYRPGLHTAAIFLGVPFVKAPAIFWFVIAIIQCYLLAPFLFAVMRRITPPAWLVINLWIVGIFYLISELYLSTIGDSSPMRSSDIEALFYHRFFLANVVLFSLGMLIPVLTARQPRGAAGSQRSPRHGEIACLVSFSLFVALLYLTRDGYSLFNESSLMLSAVFILSAFIFCLCLFAWRPPLPLKRIFILPGRHSYPVYLLHMPYLAALAGLGLIGGNDWKSTVIASCFLVGLIKSLSLMDEISFPRLGSNKTNNS